MQMDGALTEGMNTGGGETISNFCNGQICPDGGAVLAPKILRLLFRRLRQHFQHVRCLATSWRTGFLLFELLDLLTLPLYLFLGQWHCSLFRCVLHSSPWDGCLFSSQFSLLWLAHFLVGVIDNNSVLVKVSELHGSVHGVIVASNPKLIKRQIVSHVGCRSTTEVGGPESLQSVAGDTQMSNTT